MKTKFFQKIILVSMFLLALVGINYSYAQQWRRGRYGETPIKVFDNAAWDVNTEDGKVQENALNTVSDTEGSYPHQYKISNTLESIRKHIYPYLDWLVYIGTTLAVILLIYNWVRLIVGMWSFDHSKALWNIKNIAIWVWVLRWFRAILKLSLIIINAVAWK